MLEHHHAVSFSLCTCHDRPQSPRAFSFRSFARSRLVLARAGLVVAGGPGIALFFAQTPASAAGRLSPMAPFGGPLMVGDRPPGRAGAQRSKLKKWRALLPCG